ncbi:MAG: AEC family transporter [Akkermansiaceae bacterium]|nr:AEC family transporter [Akkermansiaceae bacterium]
MNTLDIALQSFLSTIPIYIFFGIGFMLRRKGAVLPAHDSPIMSLAMDIAYPCLILHSILKYMALSDTKELRSIAFSLQAIAAGACELIVGVCSAYAVAKIMRLRIGTGLRTFSLTAGIQNYAFFVIPIIQIVFDKPGDPTLGVLFVHNVGCELVVWSLGVIIMAGGVGQLRLGVFMRGPLLAVAFGLALAWTGAGSYLAVPPLMKTLEMIGNCATPLCLVLFGCSMYDSWGHTSWRPRLLAAGLLTRLVAAPALILLLAWILPLDIYIKRIMTIQAAIPSAVIPVILAKRFGGLPEMGTQILLATTVASALTLPIWLAIGNIWVAPLIVSP